MATEEYTEQSASRYRPQMWAEGSTPAGVAPASATSLLKRPGEYRRDYYCNHGEGAAFCRRQQTWDDYYCTEHIALYEPIPLPMLRRASQPGALKRALRSRPARYLVFGLRWFGVGPLLGLYGLNIWQLSFYAVLIPMCVALAYVAAWQRKGA